MNDSVSYAFAQTVGNFAVIDYGDIAGDDLPAVLDDLNTLQAQGFQIISTMPGFLWLMRSPQKAQSDVPYPI